MWFVGTEQFRGCPTPIVLTIETEWSFFCHTSFGRLLYFNMSIETIPAIILQFVFKLKDNFISLFSALGKKEFSLRYHFTLLQSGKNGGKRFCRAKYMTQVALG